MDGKFKIVAVLQGQPLFTGNRYRLLSIYTGEWWDLPLTAIMQHGFKIQLGRVFVPTALDYPVFSPYDGLSYELPFIPEGRKVPSRNDTVIVLGEKRRGTEVQGALGILLSEKIFNEMNDKLTSEWEMIKRNIGAARSTVI